MDNNFYILCLGTLNVNNGVQQDRKEGKEESGNTQAEPGEESSNLENKESRKRQAQPSSIPKFLGSGISIKIPDCLNTPEVWKFWNVSISHGWVAKGNLKLLVPLSKGSLLAHRIADVQKMDKFWSYFESLWGCKNLKQRYIVAFGEKSLKSFYGEVVRLIR